VGAALGRAARNNAELGNCPAGALRERQGSQAWRRLKQLRLADWLSVLDFILIYTSASTSLPRDEFGGTPTETLPVTFARFRVYSPPPVGEYRRVPFPPFGVS
jgi:hypothetical protein